MQYIIRCGEYFPQQFYTNEFSVSTIGKWIWSNTKWKKIKLRNLNLILLQLGTLQLKLIKINIWKIRSRQSGVHLSSNLHAVKTMSDETVSPAQTHACFLLGFCVEPGSVCMQLDLITWLDDNLLQVFLWIFNETWAMERMLEPIVFFYFIHFLLLNQSDPTH